MVSRVPTTEATSSSLTTPSTRPAQAHLRGVEAAASPRSPSPATRRTPSPSTSPSTFAAAAESPPGLSSPPPPPRRIPRAPVYDPPRRNRNRRVPPLRETRRARASAVTARRHPGMKSRETNATFARRCDSTMTSKVKARARARRGRERQTGTPTTNRTDDSPRWSPRLARRPRATARRKTRRRRRLRLRSSPRYPGVRVRRPPRRRRRRRRRRLPRGRIRNRYPRRRSRPLRGRDTFPLLRARRVRSRPPRRRRFHLSSSEASWRTSRPTYANPVEASSPVGFANAARRWWTTRRPAT